MAGTVFIFSSNPGMNQQFMALNKALKELEGQEPGSEDFRQHLFHLMGLLHYQFGYEEELMQDFAYPHLKKHRDDHRRFRRELHALLDLRDMYHPSAAPSQEQFVTDLKHHAWFDDNDLIRFINNRPQTKVLRASPQEG